MTDHAEMDERPTTTEALDIGRKKHLILLIIACCVVFFIADVATPTCFEEPFSAMLALGVVTAQLTVICVWGTLVRGTFWVRLPWTLLLLVLAWCGLAWGITIAKGRPDTGSMLGVGLIWMFGFVTSFVPLKIAAICFRWQIVQDSEDHQSLGRSSSYAIRDIMIGTLLLALAMAIGRAMLPGDDISFTRALESSSLDQPEPLVAITIYGVISLLVKLPCIWISLGEKAERIKPLIGVWFIYCLGLAIIEIVLFIAIFGDPAGDTIELFAGIIISHQLMGAIMLAVCLTLRGLGYRLERSVVRKADRGSASLP